MEKKGKLVTGGLPMKKNTEELYQWGQELMNFHLPRWNELPSIDLYMDQLISLIERYLAPFSIGDEKIITAAMVNNYVKMKLIPAPEKKRYNRVHLAYLIVISTFKQVFSLSDIKTAIAMQTEVKSEKDSYNLFCEEQERALQTMLSLILTGGTLDKIDPVVVSAIPMKFASLAFANKILVQKVIRIQPEEIN